MTDYAKPTTPGDALRNAARDLLAKAKQHRIEQERQRERADALETAAYDLEADAERWDKYQPTASPAARQDTP